MNAAIDTGAGPTRPKDRIASIDVLRGFALLGILVMNIQSFSMPEAAYLSPVAYGRGTGLDYWIWYGAHILFDTKFMAMFSMLFGAGIVLMNRHRDQAGLGTAGVHYRRMAVLLCIGLVHAYGLWHGDVLCSYAVTGMWIFFFRKGSPRALFIFGVALLLVGSGLLAVTSLTAPQWPKEELDAFRVGFQPSEEAIADEIAQYRGGYLDHLPRRARATLYLHTFLYPFWMAWRVGGLMLIGMALFKWGVFSAQRSPLFYFGLILAGFCIGLPIVHWGVTERAAHDWDPVFFMLAGSLHNYWGGILVALGWVGAVVIACKTLGASPALDPLAAVGRTALSNYLFQTVAGTFVFYGYGLGWFGQLDRLEQLGIVAVIWTIQLVVSPLWLTWFRFGPVEWFWRSATYGRLQPMRVQAAH